MASKQEDKLKKIIAEEEAKRKKALGIKSEEELQSIEKESRNKALADRLKRSASTKGSVGAKAGAVGKVGDLYKPGGKKLTGIAAYLQALVDAGTATEEQKKRLKKIKGE